MAGGILLRFSVVPDNPGRMVLKVFIFVSLSHFS